MVPFQIPRTRPLRRFHHWLLPSGALLAAAGYFRPWVAHDAAGLVVLGLDLGEMVKFLYPVQQGDIRLWREAFYLPLFAISASLSLNAFRREWEETRAKGISRRETRPAYRWPARIGLLLLAVVAALNFLPPSWTPAALLTAEFRLQFGALLICLALAAFSPLAALFVSPPPLEAAGGAAGEGNGSGRLRRALWLASLLRALTLTALCAAAIYFPVFQFRWILPTLADLYGRAPEQGFGPALMSLGLAGLALHSLEDVKRLLRER